MVFVILWLISLSVIVSRSTYGVANDNISFFFYCRIMLHCMYRCICVYTHVHTYMYTHIHTDAQAACTLAQSALSMPQVWFPVCEGGSGCQLLPAYAKIWGSNLMPLPGAWWHQSVSSQLRTPPASGSARLRAALSVFSQLWGFQTIGPCSQVVPEQQHGGLSLNL